MKSVLYIAIVMLLTGVACGYDYNADFVGNYNAVTNPGGVWTYGVYMNQSGPGPYLDWTVCPARFSDSYSGTKGWIIGGPDNWGYINKHDRDDVFTNPSWPPGSGSSWREYQTVIGTARFELAGRAAGRFTAPTAGNYKVEITFENRVVAMTPTGVFVNLNAVEVFNSVVTGFAESEPPYPENIRLFPETIPLAAGDTVTFGAYNLPGELGGHNAGVSAYFTPLTSLVNISKTNLTVAGLGAGTGSYSVVLTTQPTAPVEITAYPADMNDANNPSVTNNQLNLGAGAGIAKILTFNAQNWNVPQTVTVTAVVDGPKYGWINHVVSTTDGRFADPHAIPDVFVQITGSAQILISGNTTVQEGNLLGNTLGVKLQAVPTSNVTVGITPADGQLTVEPNSLVFTPANYSTVQNVTVKAPLDGIPQPYNHTDQIAFVGSSSDTRYQDFIKTLTITIIDKDCGAWGYNSGDINEDCKVDFKDFALIAANWLKCTFPDEPGCVNVLP